MSLKEFDFSMSDGMPLVVSNNCFNKSIVQSKVYGMCGAGLQCGGGGGMCGAGLQCSGGGGRCGAGLQCSGE